MIFKEALIAHLQGEKVECSDNGDWFDFSSVFGHTSIRDINKYGNLWKFRIAPRTVMCNGVEVPAPESVAPAVGALIYVANPTSNNHQFSINWTLREEYSEYLKRGLVYINQYDAIVRAKAMLITTQK